MYIYIYIYVYIYIYYIYIYIYKIPSMGITCREYQIFLVALLLTVDNIGGATNWTLILLTAFG